MRYVTFLAAVDGVIGVKVTRVLSMPLKVCTSARLLSGLKLVNDA